MGRVLVASWCGLACLLAPFGMFLSACQTTPPPPESPPEWPDPVEPELTLQPGDTLLVRFAYWPELNDEQAVRPDGKISLQLVGDVVAEGLTPEALREELIVRYQSKLKNPEISVLVKSFDSRRVYVGGEVQRPGVVPIRGKLSALQAIMEVGGFLNASAKPSSVILVRQRGNAQYARSIDVRESLVNPETETVFLEPYDVLFVSRTKIDRVDQFVDQHINKIIPRQFNFTFVKNNEKRTTESSSLNVTLPN